MLRTRYINTEDSQENIFWITMSDLLLGLAVVFIVLFVLAMTSYTQLKAEEQRIKSEVAADLTKELKEKNIDAQVDELTGNVKLSDMQLFELGSYELSSEGRTFLDKFIPVYVNAIYENPQIADKLEKVIIEGHTDSHTFAGISSKDEQFVRNMELSTQRANEVAKYIFYTPYNKKYSEKLYKMLVVEGKSYSEPVIVNGKEDFAKSRRVELKMVVKNTNLQDFLNIVKKESQQESISNTESTGKED